MAETIVKLVLEKVTDPVVKEVLHLSGVAEQVEKLRRELDWIRAFLKDADMKQIQEETQKQWVREVRKVAYSIEDVIATFLCLPEKKPGKREAMKRWLEKTKKVTVIHKLGEEINQILARLKEITEDKERWGIHSLGESTGGVKKLPLKPPVLPDIEDPDVVGLDKDRDNIIKQLLNETNPRRRVVSIVGTGGFGKTTLAKKVYNSHEVQRAYIIRIWITISQEFEIIDVLKKIIEKLRKIDESEEGKKDAEHFLTELHKSLKNKKYLLTIDDVWKTNLWMAIGKALPNDQIGSRILMTTRNFEVAKDVDPEHEPYILKFLTDQSSQELFLKKALPNEENQNSFPDDLYDLTQQFVEKCGGLPLALIVLGGLLAKNEATYYDWNKVMQTMNWHTSEQKVCIEIIATSFDDLPLALKSCFMYFAVFPEDHEFDVPDLLLMWIAEGFIPQEDNRILEDTAQSFLEDLAHRYLLQRHESKKRSEEEAKAVPQRHGWGRMRGTCEVLGCGDARFVQGAAMPSVDGVMNRE